VVAVLELIGADHRPQAYPPLGGSGVMQRGLVRPVRPIMGRREGGAVHRIGRRKRRPGACGRPCARRCPCARNGRGARSGSGTRRSARGRRSGPAVPGRRRTGGRRGRNCASRPGGRRRPTCRAHALHHRPSWHRRRRRCRRPRAARALDRRGAAGAAARDRGIPRVDCAERPSPAPPSAPPGRHSRRRPSSPGRCRQARRHLRGRPWPGPRRVAPHQGRDEGRDLAGPQEDERPAFDRYPPSLVGRAAPRTGRPEHSARAGAVHPDAAGRDQPCARTHGGGQRAGAHQAQQAQPTGPPPGPR
jgi:hypothetical protein